MNDSQQPAKMQSGRYREPLDRTFEQSKRVFVYQSAAPLLGTRPITPAISSTASSVVRRHLPRRVDPRNHVTQTLAPRPR